MSDDLIPKQVLQQLKQVGTETVEKAVEEAGKIGETIILGKELLGNIQPMNERDYIQKQQDDNVKRQQEINKLKQEMAPGRNVDREIEQVRDEKRQKEDEQERLMLESIKRQREVEELERAQMSQAPGNAKREAAKLQGQPGRKKSQQPDPSQMSQTSEFKGKID